MKRQMSLRTTMKLLVLLTVITGYTSASTEGCGPYGHLCVDETHFEMCVEVSGILSRSGEVQACPYNLTCSEESMSICSEILPEVPPEGTTQTESFLSMTENDVFIFSETTENIFLVTVGDSERETQNANEDVVQNPDQQTNSNQQLDRLQNGEENGNGTKTLNSDVPEIPQQQDDGREIADLLQVPMDFGVPEPTIPEIILPENPDLGLVPEFAPESEIQPNSPEGPNNQQQDYIGNPPSKLIHVEPATNIGGKSVSYSGNFTCPEAGIHPEPSDCTAYHICVQHGPYKRHYIRSCRPGLEFSRGWRTCVPRYVSDCQKNTWPPAEQISSEDSSQSEESEESQESDESNSSGR